ncbi:MAG: insulinase family protein, partial [Clostridia bacterium]|nr:insulinase family protein [Clostridia bacterium]
MEYIEKKLKEGIKLHIIKTDKFKTNLISVFLTTKLNRENVTKNAFISTILRRGSKNMKTQEEISRTMEGMYGASFDCGLDKTGDNQILKFYIETVNDNFLPQKDGDMLKTSIEKLLEIVFNPYIENESFKEEYVKQEKNNIKQRIQGKIDNKARYALDRCIEEMYKNQPYGLYKFGYIEDLEKIDGKNAYEYYKKLINSCKIDIFVSGMVDENIDNIIESNDNIKKLVDRKPDYVLPDLGGKERKDKENIVTESMEVTQGKLLLGLDVDIDKEELKYDTLIYNSILGGSANSKMFQNVREKANLAYVASSSYMRQKNNIFVNCGIEIGNYEKALELIKEQIEEMKKGEFTEEEIENAKKGIIAAIKTIDDEQDTGITYYFGQEMSGTKVTPEEYISKVQNIDKQKVQDIANKVSIN